MKITISEIRSLIRNLIKEDAWMPGAWDAVTVNAGAEDDNVERMANAGLPSAIVKKNIKKHEK